MDDPPTTYEFTIAQNETLRRAATWIGLFSWILIAGAALMLIGGVLNRDESAIGALIGAAVYFLIGLNLRGAATSMKSVVETAGSDIDHLISALDKLASAFKVMGIIFIVGVVLFVVATVALGSWMAAVGA